MSKETSEEIASIAGRVMNWTEGDLMDLGYSATLAELKKLAASCLSQREFPSRSADRSTEIELPEDYWKNPEAKRVWFCKIGFAQSQELPDGADLPLRLAVEQEFRQIVGREPLFCFSGWGGKLTHGELECLETDGNGVRTPIGYPFAETKDVLQLQTHQIIDPGCDGDDEIEFPTQFIPADVVEAQVQGEPIEGVGGLRLAGPVYSKRKKFTEELSNLINCHSLERFSDTPDFVLASFLTDTLTNFGRAMQERDRWNAPGGGHVEPLTEQNFGLYLDGWLLNSTDTVGEVQVIPPPDVEGAHPFTIKSSSLTAFLERRLQGNL